METCQALVDSFNRKSKQAAKSLTLTSRVKGATRQTSSEPEKPAEPKFKVDFRAVDAQIIDPSLEAARVIGVVLDPDSDNRYFVVRWKNPKERQVDLVNSTYANKHYPQQVIAFYESKIVFT